MEELCETVSNVEVERLPLGLDTPMSIVDLDSPWGLPTSHKLLSDQMRSAGYQTHLFGKWDIGHHDPTYWPTERGFDSYFGLLVKTYTGDNAYSTHACGTSYTDLVQDMSNAYGYDGNYSTTMFGDAAAAQVMAHDASLGPLFVYLAFNGMHAPVSLPADFTESVDYAAVTDGLSWSKRQEFAAGLYVGDQAIAKIVCKLGSTAQKVVNEIVKEYKKKQGNDDVTIVVVQLGHVPPAR